MYYYLKCMYTILKYNVQKQDNPTHTIFESRIIFYALFRILSLLSLIII